MDKKIILDVIFLLAAGFVAWQYVAPSMKGTLSSWYDPVVTPGEVEAAKWSYDNLQHQRLFAADLFACEMLTAVAFQVCSVGGAWELADNPNQRFLDNQQFFLTNSSQEAYGLVTKYGIDYAFVADRSGFYAYGWKQPALEKFSDSDYFEKIYGKDGVNIFKVKQSGARMQ